MSTEEAVKLAANRKIKLQNKNITLELTFKVSLSKDKKILTATVTKQTMSYASKKSAMWSNRSLLISLFKDCGWERER